MKIANVLMSDAWGDVTPEALETGIGGREGAMIYLSREWAKLGHEVTNFVNTEKSTRIPETSTQNIYGAEFSEEGFHEYVPISLTKPVLSNFPYDAVVAWECPSIFEDPAIRENVGVKLCEMQVAHFGPRELEAAENYCDYICALSDWHAEFLIHQGLEVDRGRVVTLPNGVRIDRYPKEKIFQKIERGPSFGNPEFVYSSSPDRGLWPLLKAWKHIRKEYPQAILQVGYGVTKWTSQVRWMHGRQGEMAVELERLMGQSGVNDIGKIGQSMLAHLQIKADLWPYPLDAIQATETGCITAVENAAAGNPIITTDCDCMEEEFGGVGIIKDLPFDAKEYANTVIEVLQDPTTWRTMAEYGRAFAETRDWSRIAPRWIELIENARS